MRLKNNTLQKVIFYMGLLSLYDKGAVLMGRLALTLNAKAKGIKSYLNQRDNVQKTPHYLIATSLFFILGIYVAHLFIIVIPLSYIWLTILVSALVCYINLSNSRHYGVYFFL